MSVTKDLDSITNSVMMAMDKELRKNGLAPAGNRHYEGNRRVISGLIAMMLMDMKEHDNDT